MSRDTYECDMSHTLERVTSQDIYTHYAEFLKAHPSAAPSGGVLEMHLSLGTRSGGALQVHPYVRRSCSVLQCDAVCCSVLIIGVVLEMHILLGTGSGGALGVHSYV